MMPSPHRSTPVVDPSLELPCVPSVLDDPLDSVLDVSAAVVPLVSDPLLVGVTVDASLLELLEPAVASSPGQPATSSAQASENRA
jgi:hypothetical protein